MAKSVNESLFLLEILVDKIVYCKAPCCPEKDFKTCVKFEFLCVDPIEITDASTGSCSAKCGGPFIKIFNVGKSCLFSLKEEDIKKAMNSFTIKVTVTKSLMCNCLPTKMNMGSCTIDVTKEFVQARKKYLENPVSGCHQSLKDSFRLVACDGIKTGDIVLFIRISCFGKHIVTKFDASDTGGMLKTEDKPSPKDRIERVCPHGKTCQSAKDPCACGAEAVPGACGVPSRRHSTSPDCDDQFPKSEYRAPLECRNTDPYCLHVPKGYNNVYEEVSANVNGNDLRIKVPTKTAIIKKLSQTHVDLQSPYMKANRGGICDAPCADNQISLSFPVHATGDELAPLQNTQFCCTTEGCPQAAKHNVSAKVASRDRIKDLPNNRDNFVLKVMKTAASVDKKSKLEFEIVTPKGPDKTPAVKRVDARNETIPECICCCTDCCPTGKKFIFQMPRDSCGLNHKQRLHFNYTTDGLGELTREDPLQLTSLTDENYRGPVCDYSNNVIKVRVAKTVELLGRKTNLEYNFITPVPGHSKTTPTRDSRAAQYVTALSSRCCSPC